MAFISLSVKVIVRSSSPELFSKNCIRLWSNFHLSNKMVCRTHNSAMQTQGLGLSSRSWDSPLNFGSMSLLPLEGFSFNFYQMFTVTEFSEMHESGVFLHA